MDKLTKIQESEAVAYMDDNDNMDFNDVATNLSSQFGVVLTGEECQQLYVAYKF